MGISNTIPPSRLIQPGVCTSSTRPTSPFEGQAIYETDTDLLRIWNGSAWKNLAATAPAQVTVLQVVSPTPTTTETVCTTATFIDTTLTATITPQSASSKILVLVNQNSCFKTGNAAMTVRLLRAGTLITTMAVNAGLTSTTVDLNFGSISTSYLDSPATTSAIIYKTQFNNATASGQTIAQYASGASTITLMEISA